MKNLPIVATILFASIFLFLYFVLGFKYFIRAGVYTLSLSKTDRLALISSINKTASEGRSLGIFGFIVGDKVGIWGLKGLKVLSLSESLSLNFNKKDCILSLDIDKSGGAVVGKDEIGKLFKLINTSNRGYLVSQFNIVENSSIGKVVTKFPAPDWWSPTMSRIGTSCSHIK